MSSLQRLIQMHTYMRPHGSPAERRFINRYIRPMGAIPLGQNWYVAVGDSRLVWSCHTDTVHQRSGRQSVLLDRKGILSLAPVSRPRMVPAGTIAATFGGSSGSCLGADNTVGVWMLVEMIRARVPGHYLFHYGEEAGCIGSRALADEPPDWLLNAEAAIAFDRRDTHEIITHQCGQRTASDAFAVSFAAELARVGLPRYRPSDAGMFTDTESYEHLIPECTNLGAGYTDAHSGNETLDTRHALRLLAAMKRLNPSALVIARDPFAVDPRGQWWDRDLPAYDICEYGVCLAQVDPGSVYCGHHRRIATNSPEYLDPEWQRLMDHFDGKDVH